MALLSSALHWAWVVSPFIGAGYTALSAFASVLPKGSKFHAVVSTVAFDVKQIGSALSAVTGK